MGSGKGDEEREERGERIVDSGRGEGRGGERGESDVDLSGKVGNDGICTVYTV